MSELYLHSTICLHGIVINYIMKYMDTFTFTFSFTRTKHLLLGLNGIFPSGFPI
jgi:hypothetical protein